MKIDNQKLFTEVSKNFPQPNYKFENHLRGILFRARYLIWKYTFDSCLSRFLLSFRIIR